ncbi:carbon-nitrogen hydrolase [Diplodia corticola]|uniref:Carbon-nitrogen hydrolase n=1 Tax=Diplodia corticola TaxID=236234 RepID=A0A1J9SEH8_9PEZI|nr:carbon-nitrogen hydrolase [Diplodia corticola]OJD38823.1 carbon-nitrogen hydrolase [Diplodia corticola]
MKIGCLQYAPEVGQLHTNMAKANVLIDDAIGDGRTAGLDWLLLPELALTGYNFASLEAIAPFLEPTAAGASTKWAVDVATRLRCHVTVGYPEQAADGRRYNSTVTVSPAGAVLANYRKTFLYYTDETWAHEGDRQFFSGNLGTLGRVSMGICMDINPQKFLAPWDAYEFARAALQADSPIIALNMAWLTRQTADEVAAQRADPDGETLAYWLERFFPLIDAASRRPPIILVMANRCGVEGGAVYAGTSTVMKVERGEVPVRIFDILGQGEENLLVADLNEAPKWSVTTRSERPPNS